MISNGEPIILFFHPIVKKFRSVPDALRRCLGRALKKVPEI